MTNTSQELTFDVVIIGAGPVGENIADRTVQSGLSTAIVERELVGGECSYWACMPTKALLRDAAAVRAARALHADGYRGQARMIIDADRNILIGVTAVGPDVAELLHAATIAITAEVPVDHLWHAVPAYPTISEIWLRLLEADGRDH